ncbi:MAG: adenylate kinase [Eubacteriales bacterium]
MRLILLGAPGSGKGTIAAELTKNYGILHISTGDIFRANMKEQTPLGLEAKSYIDQGALVPDSITIAMIEDRLAQPDCEAGFMLDGFPRTIVQAQELDRILAKKGVALTAAISIEISDDEIKKRVSGRRVCIACGASYNIPFKPAKVDGICDACGGEVIQREDDKPETVLSRLKTYHEKTQPLIDYYKAQNLILTANNEVNYMMAFEEIIKGLALREIN